MASWILSALRSDDHNYLPDDLRRPTTAGYVGLDRKVSFDAREKPGFLRFVLAFSTTKSQGSIASGNLLTWILMCTGEHVGIRIKQPGEVITVMESHEHSACLGFVLNEFLNAAFS